MAMGWVVKLELLDRVQTILDTNPAIVPLLMLTIYLSEHNGRWIAHLDDSHIK